MQRRAAALVRAQRRRQLHRQLRAQAQGSAASRLTAAAMAGAGQLGPGGRRRRAAALPARLALPTHHDPAHPCPRARRRAPGSASGPAWRPGARACSRACPWRTAAPGRPRAAAPPPRPHARAAPRGAARCAAPGLGRPGPRPALHPPASVQGGGARLPARAEGRTACRSAWAAPSALREAQGQQKHARAAAGGCTTALHVQGYCSPSPDAGCRCKAGSASESAQLPLGCKALRWQGAAVQVQQGRPWRWCSYAWTQGSSKRGPRRGAHRSQQRPRLRQVALVRCMVQRGQARHPAARHRWRAAAPPARPRLPRLRLPAPS